MDGSSHSGNVYYGQWNEYYFSFLETKKEPSRLLSVTSSKVRLCDFMPLYHVSWIFTFISWLHQCRRFKVTYCLQDQRQPCIVQQDDAKHSAQMTKAWLKNKEHMLLANPVTVLLLVPSCFPISLADIKMTGNLLQHCTFLHYINGTSYAEQYISQSCVRGQRVS